MRFFKGIKEVQHAATAWLRLPCYFRFDHARQQGTLVLIAVDVKLIKKPQPIFVTF